MLAGMLRTFVINAVSRVARDPQVRAEAIRVARAAAPVAGRAARAAATGVKQADLPRKAGRLVGSIARHLNR